jgi:hypothetical protein
MGTNMARTRANRSGKTSRADKSGNSSMSLRASVLDTLTRAGLITLGVAVTSICLWVAACVVRAIATNWLGG